MTLLAEMDWFCLLCMIASATWDWLDIIPRIEAFRLIFSPAT